jgi:hypothetical protein
MQAGADDGTHIQSPLEWGFDLNEGLREAILAELEGDRTVYIDG